MENDKSSNPEMSNEKNGENSLVYNMLGSATSGIIARIPCHPLDTMKAKLQVQQATINKGATKALNEISNIDPNINSKIVKHIRDNFGSFGKFIGGNGEILSKNDIYLRNTIHALKVTLKREGIYGLYRGGTITFIGSCPGSFLFFTTFEYFRRILSNNVISNNGLSDFIAGFLAETFSCVLWVPIDIIKERMQVQSMLDINYRYNGTINAIYKMIYNEGYLSIFRAYGATILSFGPFSAIYLSLHERFKRIILNNSSNIDTINSIPMYYIGISAGISSSIGAFITNPLDIVKVRMQVQRSGAFNFGYKNLFHGIYTLIKYENISSIFHGAGARVAFQLPNVVINLVLYEYCTRFYRNNFKFH